MGHVPEVDVWRTRHCSDALHEARQRFCLTLQVVFGAVLLLVSPSAVPATDDPPSVVDAAPMPTPVEGVTENADRDPPDFLLPNSRKSRPIQVNADMLEFDARENVAVFRGNVVTSQGDVVIQSGILRVTFAPSNGTPGGFDKLESVVAERDVRITQGGRVARGARAEFNEAERTLVLTGDTVLYEGSNEVRGERVIVYLDEERSVVEGMTNRVKAILVPKAQGEPTEDAAAGAAPGPAESAPATDPEPLPGATE